MTACQGITPGLPRAIDCAASIPGAKMLTYTITCPICDEPLSVTVGEVTECECGITLELVYNASMN